MHSISRRRQANPRPRRNRRDEGQALAALARLSLVRLFREAERAMTDIDISKIKPAGGGGNASGGAAGGGNAEGTGDGPGGARLYNAEWYREPSNAELSPYMRAARGGSTGDWAMIACRTVERFHVEDCRELDESPRGSGLARALRQAAWQFLVRPPRIDGKPQLGTWVRIRFDFKASKRMDAPAAGAD
jgi:protein TonB